MAEKKKTKEKETYFDNKLKKYSPFLIWLGILAVIFIVLYFSLQGIGKIKYQGLEFKRERFGSLLVYTYSYLVEAPNGNNVERKLYLRNDPTKNNVPVSGELRYPENKEVYISSNSTGLIKCEDTMIALSTLSIFLQNNGIIVKSGTLDKEEAQVKNYTYVTCTSYPDNPVMALRAGNETKIENVGLCYNVEIANCEILPALEKFIVQSIIDSKNRNA